MLVTCMPSLTACGVTRAVHDTGRMADKYGCLARELKGEQKCRPADPEAGAPTPG
jgi:hypothetical protein